MTDVEEQTNVDLDKGEAVNTEESDGKLSWKDRIIGDYSYGRFCKPRLNPWKKESNEPMPFYGRNAHLAWLVTAMLGFQHSLAVVAGTIIPGVLIGQLDPSGDAGPKLVSYALITSGICTWIQIAHTPIPKTKYFLGSGMLCVIATSFAFLDTTLISVKAQMEEGLSFDEAYGNLLGCFLVGAILQSGFSFIPGPTMRRIFPPWLAGLAVFLIGISLVGVGAQSWGGGGDCASGGICSSVGDSSLEFGSAEYIGLGFLVMSIIVLIELFGSVFMRSCSFAIALLLGYLISSFTVDRNGDKYTNRDAISEAPPVLFLWVKTFPIGFYTPALLPVLIGFIVSTIETYGDSSATAAASGMNPKTKAYDEAIQGGLLGDSFNSFFSALAMVLPSTTLSQNIGIISITKVASRSAGYACGMWMILYGIFGKVGAFFTSIPQPVLGGMTTFLFANMTVSGIKVMTSEPVDRRERFILAVAASFGLGTILVPNLFNSNLLDCGAIDSPGVQGLCSAAQITLSTGYAIGCLVALFLNAILPADDEEEVVFENNDHVSTSLVEQTLREEQDSSHQSEEDESREKVATMEA